MTAPTEEEIRAAIAREWGKRRQGQANIARDFSDALTGAQLLLEDLYDTDDFRKAEGARFDTLAYEAIRPIRDAAAQAVVEAMVRAGLQFAAEYPDAPRLAQEAALAESDHA